MGPTPRTAIRIKYRHWAFRLPLLRRYRGIVVGRRIWFKNGPDEISAELLRHEMIHQEQMDRHTVPLFYLIYLKDYLRNLLRYHNHDLAYWNIPFEIEARERAREPSAPDRPV